MYLRHTIRKKDGKVHRYWRLVRSVRIGRRVIQQTVAHLGGLHEQGRIDARALARQLIGSPEQARLFDDGCRDVTVPVRLKGIRIERSRQFGDVYLALALWRGTGLAELCERLLPHVLACVNAMPEEALDGELTELVRQVADYCRRASRRPNHSRSVLRLLERALRPQHPLLATTLYKTANQPEKLQGGAGESLGFSIIPKRSTI